MPTLGELDQIRRTPQPAYPQYTALRAEAERTCPRFVDPAGLPRTAAMVGRRGSDWCTAVLGYPFPGLGRGGISVLEAHLLGLADERDLNPPLPAPVLRWRAEAAEARAEKQRRIDAARDRDRQAWQTALSGCPVPLQVRANVAGRRTNSPYLADPLRHAVPTTDAHSGTVRRPRQHLAGQALCETAGRARPLNLAAQPTDQPVTCVRCLAYTPMIRLAKGVAG
ncbi:hypothetical protein [Micromonospora sp. NPDC049662]|uniref:hypothetical protein n=1 Tax=Micromonospora sp. NPDC049662 TaxID=3155397 RepID=UPI00342746CB